MGNDISLNIEIKKRSMISFDSIKEFNDYVDSIKSTLSDNEKIVSAVSVTGCVFVIKTT